MSDSHPKASSLLPWLWVVVILELVSPVPAILTFGAIYVLVARPEGFRRMVEALYSPSGDPER